MTELERVLEEAGVKVQALTADAREKTEAYIKDQKSKLDTETRRKVRAMWVGFTTVGVALGGLAGWFLRGFAG